MLPFSSRLVFIATLAVIVGVVCTSPVAPAFSSNPSSSESSILQSSPHKATARVSQAQLGILPDVRGLSLDLVLLGLLGAGYAIARLQKSDRATTPHRTNDRSDGPPNVRPEHSHPSPLASGSG